MNEHLNKGIDFWNKVLFTDESKNLFDSDERSYVWRKVGEGLKQENVNC